MLTECVVLVEKDHLPKFIKNLHTYPQFEQFYRNDCVLDLFNTTDYISQQQFCVQCTYVLLMMIYKWQPHYYVLTFSWYTTLLKAPIYIIDINTTIILVLLVLVLSNCSTLCITALRLKLKLIYDWRSVDQSLLVSDAYLGPVTNFSFAMKFPVDSGGFVIL
jgi:hypothetical protein